MPAPPFHIVAASPAHIPHLAAHMRSSDAAEVWAASAQSPRGALGESLGLSTRAWCLLAGGQPVAMWGVGAGQGLLSPTGAPWLLATDAIRAFSRPLLRLSRRYVALMHEDFPQLKNHVHARNRASLRWLVWCGFTLAPRPAPHGPFNEPFYRFWRTQCATSAKPWP